MSAVDPMAGPSATPRQRASSVSGHDSAPVSAPLAAKTRRSTRGTLSFLFPRPDRSRTIADPPTAATNTTQSDDQPPPERRRTNSRPTLLVRSLTSKPRATSRAEQVPALPSIFASLPGRTRDSLRQSYDAPRRPTTSFERTRTEVLALNKLSLGPVDIPDPETPTPNPHSFRLSESTQDEGYISSGRRSMASFARSPITTHHPMRRASGLLLNGDDLDSCEAYRASTADLSEFLRATGPEDLHKGVPGSPVKDSHDRDGASSTRSRTRSSLFRLGGRRREKSRPTVGPGISSNDPLPPVPTLSTPGLPAFRIRDDEDSDARTSFSHILPMFGLNDEGTTQSVTHGSANTHLPPNTREHRLPDGTTILMITTPQNLSDSKALAHSRSLNSMNDVVKEESARPALLGSSSTATVKPTVLQKSLYSRSSASPKKSALKTHSPSMSISSDGTLSTTERPRETDRLAYTQFTLLPHTPSKAVTSHSSMTNLQSSFLQTPTRPRGYSSPDPATSPSPQSTPTLKTPTPMMSFSPSASIAPTPELTPTKDMVRLPVLKVDLAPVVAPRKGSLSEPIVVDGLQFPTPPDNPLPTRRRPTTVDVSRTGVTTVAISPTRSSKSLRVARSPRKVSDPADESQIKGKRGLRPLNLEVVPTYREWKTNAPSIQTQPGELTGLELDLNDGVAGPELGRKRDSLMEQHQQLFLSANGAVVNPFQTPPSPVDPFGPPLAMESFVPPPARNSFASPPARNSFGPLPRDRDSFVPPLAGGPPLMPLPPSPSLQLQLPPSPSLPSPSSPRPSSLAMSSIEPRQTSLTPRRRSRVDSLMVPHLSSSPTSPPASATSLQTVMSALSAQREQFDSMSNYLIDAVKSYEEEKRAFELRIQELVALVAEKDAKAKEDERKIQGLEWLVGNLNLRVAKEGNNTDSDNSASDKLRRRRSSFAGLGANEDVPETPVPMERALDANERAKRTASMDDVIRNLGAMGAGRNIYEWAANTAIEQDPIQD